MQSDFVENIQQIARSIPYAVPIGVAALFPALIALRLIQSKSRRQHGHCVACNYDLVFSTETCPECGMEANSWSMQSFRRWVVLAMAACVVLSIAADVVAFKMTASPSSTSPVVAPAISSNVHPIAVEPTTMPATPDPNSDRLDFTPNPSDRTPANLPEPDLDTST